MIEEALPGIYMVKIALPRNPLKALNSYVVKTSEASFIVDTGMNRPECIDAWRHAIEELRLDLDVTDFFITHLHADHVGLVCDLPSDRLRIYFNRPDAEWLSSSGYWAKARHLGRMNGFPEDELKRALSRHPGYIYTVKREPRFTLLSEGDVIRAGRYAFECIETPGHTEGHTCLYERRYRILISGDHVLGDITPNISGWSGDQDTLRHYLRSLKRVYEMDVDYVLPGHRKPFEDCKGRIMELMRHHEARLCEVARILERGPQDAYKVASEMEWDIDCKSWNEFPAAQKWFAVGEAIAHLRYLEVRGLVRKELIQEKTWFSLAVTDAVEQIHVN